jgi:hypothetical protein
MRYQIPIKTGSIVSILIGAVIALYGGCQVKEGLATSSWPTVEGVITASSTTSKRESASIGSGRTTVYRAKVEYTYEVNGERIVGDRITVRSRWRGNSRAADDDRMKYRRDAAVTVHYDPADPGSSVLEPGVNTSSYGWFALGLLMLVVGTAARLGLFGSSFGPAPPRRGI